MNQVLGEWIMMNMEALETNDSLIIAVFVKGIAMKGNVSEVLHINLSSNYEIKSQCKRKENQKVSGKFCKIFY